MPRSLPLALVRRVPPVNRGRSGLGARVARGGRSNRGVVGVQVLVLVVELRGGVVGLPRGLLLLRVVGAVAPDPVLLWG